MKRKKFLLYIFCVNNVLFYCCGAVESSPAQNLHSNIPANKFKTVVQQQDFLTILTSIEERLRNLDNIYSMQLSQTLESKLDQYNRRLQALDTKIIRLEALVMLNLDKISENISTKNFKDDVAKTNTFRKIDSIYESISHRLNYMDRKYETNFAKIQIKMDTTLTRLENLEERMITRDSDIEAELSDTMFAIDELKATYNVMEGKLLNVTTSTFNITKNNYLFFKEINVETRKAANRLHDNIIESLKYIDNKTSAHFKIVQENNIMLKTMKTELKQDFNDYANKVADMNSYIWKNGDTTEDDLKAITTVVNSTKIEVQNGVRSLMLQIGKFSNKANYTSIGGDTLEDLNNKLNSNFNKILKNQDLFLESCHRLQMDESQIETEISAMLEKLIDMLEKKMATEMKDIKNFEKLLKGHDNRVNRNLYDVNSNIFSFYGKITAYNDDLKREISKIINELHALFTFVQSTATTSSPYNNTKMIVETLHKIESLVGSYNKSESELHILMTSDNNAKQEITRQIQMITRMLQSIDAQIIKDFNVENITNAFNTTLQRYFKEDCSKTKINNTSEIVVDEDTRQIFLDIFGPNPNITDNTTNDQNTANIGSEVEIDKDTQEVLLDIFGPNPNLTENTTHIIKTNRTAEIEIDADTKQVLLDIFGPNPNLTKANLKVPEFNKKDNKCKENYSKLVTSGIGKKCDEPKQKLNKKTKKGRRRKKPYQIDARGDFTSSEDIEYEEEEEDTENVTTDNSNIDDIDVTTEITTHINEDVKYSFLGIKPNDTANRT